MHNANGSGDRFGPARRQKKYRDRQRNGERVVPINCHGDRLSLVGSVLTGKDECSKSEATRAASEFAEFAIGALADSSFAQQVKSEMEWNKLFKMILEDARKATPITITYRKYSDGSITAEWPNGQIFTFPKGEHQIWVRDNAEEKVLYVDQQVMLNQRR